MIMTVAQTISRVSNDCMIQHNEWENIGLMQENLTIANSPYGALNTTPGKHIGQSRYSTAHYQTQNKMEVTVQLQAPSALSPRCPQLAG
jgi:hypothetical protein